MSAKGAVSASAKSAASAKAEAGANEGDGLGERLRVFEGQPSGSPVAARDEVNQSMIRHWVDAMGDANPVYVDVDAARANGFDDVIAPPTMLQAWIMRGYRAPGVVDTDGWGAGGDSAQEKLFGLLNEAGFTSVVATNCEQDYVRPLVLGDRLTVTSVIEAVSDEKHTALGDGHFVTTRSEYTDQDGALVATMRFRILRFRPRPAGADSKGATAPDAAEGGADAPRPLRPRPALTQDNAFFFEGTAAGRLLIQRCASCGVLRHPPRPACAACGSFEWDTLQASGRGTVFSFVVVHHPQVPGFDYPLPIAVVELEEGTRLVADLVGVAPDAVEVGMPVEVEMVAVDDELTLPMFRPVGASRPDGGGAR